MSALRDLKDRVRDRVPAPVLDRWHDLRLLGLPKPLRVSAPHSLVTHLNLLFLGELTARADRLGVPDDVVECGVYRGGSAGVLGAVIMERPESMRRLWLFDAFRGMPPAGDRDDALSHQIQGDYVGSERQTRRILARLGVPPERYKIVAGWYADTLPFVSIDRIALLHVDCDFYEPVKLSLERFYPCVSPGGHVVINDYGAFSGAHEATDEYLARVAPELTPTYIDAAAVFVRKPDDR